MKKLKIYSFMLLLAVTGFFLSLSKARANWQGVDDTVVGKIARETGHPARKPFINTEQGDLLLFCFLLAGATGGFVGGYCFREIFHSKGKEANHVPKL